MRSLAPNTKTQGKGETLFFFLLKIRNPFPFFSSQKERVPLSTSSTSLMTRQCWTPMALTTRSPVLNVTNRS